MGQSVSSLQSVNNYKNLNMNSPTVNLLCGESPLPLLPSSPSVLQANPSIHVGPTTIDVKPMVDEVLLNDHRVLDNMLKEEILSSEELQDYFETLQTEIKPRMRKIVTDWMLEVCEDSQCQPEVFYLSINYLDRFLSKVNIQKNQFQLVASVCVFIASKFSEVVPISSEKLCCYTDNAFSFEEIRDWELTVLNVLNWELSAVTSQSFLEHFINGLSLDKSFNLHSVRRHAETLATIAATEYKFLKLKQSIVAAACLSAACSGLFNDQEKAASLLRSLSDRIKASPQTILTTLIQIEGHIQMFTQQQKQQQSSSVSQCQPSSSSHPVYTTSVSCGDQTPTDSMQISQMVSC